MSAVRLGVTLASVAVAALGSARSVAAQQVARGPAAVPCAREVALAGTIRTLDSLPVANARVTVAGKPVETRTGSDGRFELRCLGQPGDLAVRVSGDGYEPLAFTLSAPAVATVSVALTMRETFPVPAPAEAPMPVPQAPMPVAPSAVPARATSGPAGSVSGFIRGVIRDDAGQPLRAVRVELMGSPTAVMTDPDGRFAFPNVPFGPYLVRVRRIGFEPQMFTLRVESAEPSDLDIRLSKAPALDTVKVVAKDPRAERLRGFYQRKASITTSGLFIEEEEIRNRKPFNTSDLLRARPGLLVSRDNQGQTVVFGRNMHIVGGWCPLALFVDGVPFNRLDGYIDRFVPVDNVKAIEVYPSAVSVPIEFQRQMSGCGAVVVWTK